MIRTVRGDILPEQLGHCQSHEHIFIAKGRSFDVNPALCIDSYEKSLEELRAYRNAGGAAILDAQPMYFGRMASCLCRASENSGVNIIAVTGFHKMVFCEEDSFAAVAKEDKLREFFIKEVTQGLISECGEPLGARAGAIKAAVDRGGIHSSVRYETLFAAAAGAAHAVHAPVLIHMEKGADALEIIKFFEAYGVEAERLIICHLDRTHIDAGYHKEVLAAGAYLNYDSVNRLKYVSHAQEIEMIRTMIAAGYASRLMLSLDTTRERLAAYGAGMGLSYILTDYIPMLLSNGVDAGAIKAMTVSNPSKALALRGAEKGDAKC